MRPADAFDAALLLAEARLPELAELLSRRLICPESGRGRSRRAASSAAALIGMQMPSTFLTCDYSAEVSFDPKPADLLTKALCLAFERAGVPHHPATVFEYCLYPPISAEFVEQNPQILSSFTGTDRQQPLPIYTSLVCNNCRRRTALERVLDLGVSEADENAIKTFLYEGHRGRGDSPELSGSFFFNACRALSELCRKPESAGAACCEWLDLLLQQGWGNEHAQGLLLYARSQIEARAIEPAACAPNACASRGCL